MLGLAIHTSSPELGLALGGVEGVRYRTWPLGRELSVHFHTYLKDFIVPHCWQELSMLAVAIGPGGFTGTRVGVVAARTLAQQLQIPLFGISSLAAVAYAQSPPAEINAPSPIHIAVEMRAQRGELFGGIYAKTSKGLVTHLGDQVFSQERWRQLLADWPTDYHLVKAETGLATTVEQVLMLAIEQWQRGERRDWTQVLPYYGQHPIS